MSFSITNGYFVKNGSTYTATITVQYVLPTYFYTNFQTKVSKFDEGINSNLITVAVSTNNPIIEGYTATKDFSFNITHDLTFKDNLQYTFYVTGTLDTGATTTRSISLWTNTISSSYPSNFNPTFYPTVKHQFKWEKAYHGFTVEEGTCLANQLSTNIEVMEYRQTGYYQVYSAGWIYGNRLSTDFQGNGLYIEQACERLKVDGVPAVNNLIHNVVDGQDLINDNRTYKGTGSYTPITPDVTAETFVSDNKAQTFMIENATKQCINAYSVFHRITSEWMYIDWNVIEQVKQHVINYGCAIVGIILYNNFYTVNSTYIPPPNYFNDPNNPIAHALTILGWTTVNGRLFWICQNSWGSGWGSSGICYLPADYFQIQWYALLTPSTRTCKVHAPTITIQGFTSSSDNITVTWQNCNTASSYDVILKNINNTIKSQQLNQTGTSVTFTNISKGTDFYLEFIAKKDALTDMYKIQINTTPILQYYGYSKPYWNGSPNLLYTDGKYITVSVGYDNTYGGLMDYHMIKITNKSTGKQGWLFPIDKSSVINGTTYYYLSWYKIDMCGLTGGNGSWFYEYLTANTYYDLECYTSYKGRLSVTSTKFLTKSPTGFFSWMYSGKDVNGNWVAGTEKSNATDIYFGIKDEEWNRLCVFVNEKLALKNANTLYYTKAISGNTFYYYMFNEVKNAINSIASIGITDKISGNSVLASDLNLLKTTINNVT